MERSGGVTASAILVFIGSGLTLLFAVFSVLAFFVVRDIPAQPPFVRYVMAGIGILEVAFAVWGILSGIGLLRLRRWARISMLVFSGILLFFTLPVLLIVPWMHLPAPEGTPGNFALFMKVFLVVCYGIPAAIGGWWLYFFNRRSVKDQFRGSVAAAETSAASARPLSITIIGWILVVGALFVAPFMFLHFPIFFFGYLFDGVLAHVVGFGWCVVQVVAGVGLLRLKPWGRTLAICALLFGMLSGLASLFVPGSHARLQQATALVLDRLGVPHPPGAIQEPVPYWAGLVVGFVIVAVQLWFIVTRKKAFLSGNETPTQSVGN